MPKGLDNTPFFVLGAARSGTTLLRLMLNRHSRLAIPFESCFLQDVFRAIPRDRPLDAQEAARTAELVINNHNWRAWHLDAAWVREELIRLAPAPLSVLVDALFKRETAPSGKPRWGDKTPHYYTCWREMLGLFPGSKLVHIIRDGRDVWNSLKTLGWHGPTGNHRICYWLDRVERANIAGRELGPQRNLIIRYEDLVLETRATLAVICDFLQETFEPQMLRYFEDAAEHLCDIDGDVHGKTRRPPSPADVARWRHEMSLADQLEFEKLAGSTLCALSYPCQLSHVPAPLDATLRIIERNGSC
jgi:hypothetical protein